MPKIAVLGAGLAGLSCAYELSKKGFNVTVFEKDSGAGGLAKSISNSFTSDLGPHRFHPKNKKLVRYFEEEFGIKFVERKRKSMIFINGKLIDYPLEFLNVLKSIPLSESFRMSVDYFFAKFRRDTKKNNISFEDWVKSRFGKRIYEVFFKGYTEKILGLDCRKVSRDWSEQRIKLSGLKSIFKFLSSDKGKGPESMFFYPEKGGIGSFSKAFENGIRKRKGKIKLNSRIKKIIKKGKKPSVIEFEQGGKKFKEKFDFFVSTIPIGEFARLIASPQNIIETGKKLDFRSIVFVFISLNNPSISNNHWIYFPEKKFFCNRISEPKNFSGKNVPKEKSVMCVEITCSFNDAIWKMSNEALAEASIASLSGAKIFSIGDVADYAIVKERFVYPVYDINYKENREKVLGYISGFGNVKCIGRSGAFKYCNMDVSIEEGLKAAKAIQDQFS